MSEDYIKHFFNVIDGKVEYEKLGQKRRGRKPGYKHSPETKEKIAEKMKGRTKPEEVRAQISESLKGRPKTEEVKEKISKSKTKHTIAEDLLGQYQGLWKEKDIPTSTIEWMAKCGHNVDDICKWIKENYDMYNKCKDICTESHLKALSIKEEVSLEQDFKDKDNWG